MHPRPDCAALCGALCSVIPPRYACGQGFANDRMLFGLENGVRAELRFAAGRCDVWPLACPQDQAGAYARVYGPLFEELVRRLDMISRK